MIPSQYQRPDQRFMPPSTQQPLGFLPHSDIDTDHEDTASTSVPPQTQGQIQRLPSFMDKLYAFNAQNDPESEDDLDGPEV